MTEEIVPYDNIEKKIYLIRGQKVMLDRDLAILYGVENRALKQAVKRNISRFPVDFMFILTNMELNLLVSQNVIPSRSYFGGASPFVFTEQGIAMLSTVLNSERAIQMNIAIMRAFVRIRQIVANNAELSKKFELLEKRVLKHDSDIRELVRDIRKLSVQPGKVNKIGFLK